MGLSWLGRRVGWMSNIAMVTHEMASHSFLDAGGHLRYCEYASSIGMDSSPHIHPICLRACRLLHNQDCAWNTHTYTITSN
jgi:hypothetical protein